MALLAASCFYRVEDLRSDSDVKDASVDAGSDVSTASDATSEETGGGPNDAAKEATIDAAEDSAPPSDAKADTSDAPTAVGCAAATPFAFACADFEPPSPYGTFGSPAINGTPAVDLLPGAAVAGTTILTIDQTKSGSGAQLSQSFVVPSASKPQVTFWLKVEQVTAQAASVGRLHLNNPVPNTPQLDYTLKTSPTRLELSESLASGSSTLTPVAIPLPLNEWVLVETVLNPPTASTDGSVTLKVTQNGTPKSATLGPLLTSNNWPTGPNTSRVQVLVGVISSTGPVKLSLDDVLLWLD